MDTETEEAATAQAARLRVLLIGDGAAHRQPMKSLLEECRCEVSEIEEDEDCLQAARRIDPHVVIADAGTPEDHGLGAIAAIRDARPETCVIALANSGNPDFLRLAIQLGVDGVLDSAATPESAQKAIRKALVARRNGSVDRVVPARRTSAVETHLPAFVYRPTWDVTRNLISTYFCVPELPAQQPPANTPGGLPLTSAQAAATANLDILALRKVISDLEAQRQAGQRVLLGCAVHFSTLKNPVLRDRYLSVCRSIDQSHRSDLILEMILTADDTGRFRAVDTACALETYCRAKLVRLPRHRTSFVALERQRIHAVGFDQSGAAARDRHLVDEFKGFAAAATRAGFRTYVRGLASVNQASAAVCAGFDYADGDAIRKVTAEPNAIYRYDLRDLVRRSADPACGQAAAAG